MKEEALTNIFGETIHVDFLENAAEKIPKEATSFAKWLIEESEPNKEFSFANYWEKLPIVYDKMVRLLCASLDANIVKFTNDPVRIAFAITPQVAERIASQIQKYASSAVQNETTPISVVNEMFFVPQGEDSELSFWIEENRLRRCWGKRPRIVVPDEAKKIGSGCFWECDWLEEITIPDHISYIGKSAFRACSNLKKIQLPQELFLIGEETFRDCSGLETISIPDCVQIIRSQAFWGCTALRNIKWSQGLKFIGPAAFLECTALTELRFPNSLLAIYEGAFDGCSNLRKVYIPNHTVVSKYAFPSDTEIIRF